MLSRLFTLVDRTLLILAAAAIFIMLSVTVLSVIGRYFFNMPIPDDIVINELLMVFLVFLPFAYVQRKRQHVFVSLLTDWFDQRTQYNFEVFGNVIGLIIFGFLTYASWNDFSEAYEVLAYNEGILELPEYPSRFAVFFGILIMTLRLAFDVAVGIGHLSKGTRPAFEPQGMDE